MKISEIYESKVGNRISMETLKTLKMPLTISNVEIVGKSRKGVLLSFEETPLQHKCNHSDTTKITKLAETDDTEDFEGMKIKLAANADKIIRVV